MNIVGEDLWNLVEKSEYCGAWMSGESPVKSGGKE